MKKNKVYIIAEVAQAHDGSLGIAHSYIDALSKSGIDAVKFQTHIAKAESSAFEPFRVNFTYQDATRFDYWKRMEFSLEQWIGLKKHCNDVGLEFISSPFSNAAVDLLEKVGVNYYKIGSGEVNNYLLLEKVAKTGKSIILSSGLSSMNELDDSISFLHSFGNDLSILQCTTAYPTEPGQWGLNILGELKSRYCVPVGYSDHSGKAHPSIAAVALGAELLEFHVIFDQQMFGPDAKASLCLQDVKQVVVAVRELEEDRKFCYTKAINPMLSTYKNIFEKSLAINKNMVAGDIITFNDLEAKKPKGYGIDACHYKKVIGHRIKKDLLAFDFITEEDLL